MKKCKNAKVNGGWRLVGGGGLVFLYWPQVSVEITPKYSPILKFKILNPKKWPEPTYVWKYLSTPPPPGYIPQLSCMSLFVKVNTCKL